MPEYRMLPVLGAVEVRFRGRAWSSTLVNFFTTASSRDSIYHVGGRFWLARLAQLLTPRLDFADDSIPCYDLA